MRAIILAAGVGKRLWAITQHHPKCLIEVGGRSLLLRYMDALVAVGIRQVVIVVGYKQDMIRAALGTQCNGIHVRYLVNEQFHRGSISSLWEARKELDDDAVIMDADVLFHQKILDRLMRSSHASALCLDETVKQQTEECMAVIKGGRVVALTKTLPSDFDFAGEGVGFLKVSRDSLPVLMESVQFHVGRDRWNMEYEDALVEFFQRVPVGYEKIGGLPWVEIDFPQDLERAEQEIVPKLS